MIPAIASPSLNSATNASTSRADGRARKDRTGSITACRKPRAGDRRAGVPPARAASVTSAPAAISTATPSSATCQPTTPDAAMTPVVETSIATR